jgi:prepilin-type N-terminal cleavage/methylation domain-containing protein
MSGRVNARAPFCAQNVSGLTLVELLISVALFGVLSLAVAEIFVYFTTQTVRSEREIQMNESIREFHEYVDLELGNATQIIGCRCGPMPSSGLTCRYNPSNAIGNDCGSSGRPCGDILLTWETENSQRPFEASAVGNCNGAGDLRGCRQFRSLRVTPATDTTPGLLTLENSQTGQVLSRLSGVTEVYCGMTHPTQNNGFRLRTRLKSRFRNGNDSASPDFESWRRDGNRWQQGLHREVNIEVDFRNLGHPGLHYGKSSTQRNCLPDGRLSGDEDRCCSGYLNRTGTRCWAQASCGRAGSVSPRAENCCSHQRTAAGVCR